MKKLNIEYKTKQMEKVCTIHRVAVKKHGEDMACKIAQRIQELTVAETVEQLIQYSIGRCHQLRGDRSNEYAMDLVHPYRLIFKKKQDVLEVVLIISIEDYH